MLTFFRHSLHSKKSLLCRSLCSPTIYISTTYI
nr:MAG TPA: hypothetical protein [Caudoviricetes sp.]